MRPKFLDQPYFSTRAPRTSDSRAEYASPVHHYTRRHWYSDGHTWVLVVSLIGAIVLVLLAAAGMLPGGAS